MELIVGFIGISYLITIGVLSLGITKVKKASVLVDIHTKLTDFTILIPFRNEKENLPFLLQSISQLNYPTDKYQVILINDQSTDNSTIAIEYFFKKHSDISYQIIDRIVQSNSPKKDAISQGVANTQSDWITTTDADCLVHPEWLQTLHQKIYTNNPKMIVGSVVFPNENGILNQFQYYDLISLQGVTIGSFGQNFPFMCNGANFAYTKSFFKTLNGFDGSDNIASGDDVFLLQKAIKENLTKVHYLLDSQNTVTTSTETSWKALFKQRVRWAAKTSSYTDPKSKQIALIVFVMNLLLACSPLLIYNYWNNILEIWGIKLLIDIFFIRLSAKKLQQPFKILPVLVSGLIYPFFSSAVALYSLFGKFDWKGRRFRK